MGREGFLVWLKANALLLASPWPSPQLWRWRLRPAHIPSYGVPISGRILCIACMGPKHSQASPSDPQSCPHCASVPVKPLDQRFRAAVADGQNSCVAAASFSPDVHQTQASTWWTPNPQSVQCSRSYIEASWEMRTQRVTLSLTSSIWRKKELILLFDHLVLLATSDIHQCTCVTYFLFCIFHCFSTLIY